MEPGEGNEVGCYLGGGNEMTIKETVWSGRSKHRAKRYVATAFSSCWIYLPSSFMQKIDSAR